MYYLPAKPNHSVAFELSAIAKGWSNNSHDNFNTQYRNRGGEMPSRNNPFDRVRAVYYEYGWLTTIPKGNWKSWMRADGRRAPRSVQDRLGGFLETDGGKMNTERLIFSATGEIFYTPDHYLTFWRYSPKFMLWSLYESPESRYGADEPEWDASFYYDPDE